MKVNINKMKKIETEEYKKTKKCTEYIWEVND